MASLNRVNKHNRTRVNKRHCNSGTNGRSLRCAPAARATAIARPHPIGAANACGSVSHYQRSNSISCEIPFPRTEFRFVPVRFGCIVNRILRSGGGAGRRRPRDRGRGPNNAGAARPGGRDPRYVGSLLIVIMTLAVPLTLFHRMEGSPPGISHQLPLHGNRHRLVLRTSNADSASRRIRLTDSVSAVWR